MINREIVLEALRLYCTAPRYWYQLVQATSSRGLSQVIIQNKKKTGNEPKTIKNIMETILEQQITLNSERKPVIAGTDISVEMILEKLKDGWFSGDIIKDYPELTEEAILAAVKYVEFLPAEQHLVKLLQQYREKIKQKTNALLIKLKQALINLYGERLIQTILFGSVARGEPSPDSDVDVLVVLKDSVEQWVEIERTSKIIDELSLQSNELINCIFMDEDHFQNGSALLLRNIRQEGVVI